MQSTKFASLAALGLAASLATAAQADEMMTTDQLSALLTGNTLYVDLPAGAPGAPDGGTAPIYYDAAGAAMALLPAGPKLVGTWSLGDDGYCIDWDNGPQYSCTRIMRGPDGFVVIDANAGEPRGIVTRIATGNAENL